MNRRQRMALRAAFLLAAIGLGLASYLTFRHFAAAGGGRSVCSINLKLNCDVVNTSEYSELLGIPVSALGAVLYLAIVVLSGVTLGVRRSLVPSLLSHLTVVAAAAVAYSVFLAGVSHFVIHHWCLFCIGLYVVNLGLLVCTAVGSGIPIAGQLEILKSDWTAIRARRALFASIVLVALLVVGAVGGWSWLRARQLEARDAAVVAEWKALTPITVPISGNEPTRGPSDAPVVVVEYFDLLCGHCKKQAPALEKLVEEFPGQVRVVLKHVPLDPACNEWANPHPGACEATAAALCAQQQGRYWEMHDWIFLLQSEINEKTVDAQIGEISRRIGLDGESLRSCMASPETTKRIKAEVKEGIFDLGVQSTPTLFVNGRGIQSAMDLPLLRRLVTEALALSKTAASR